MNLSLNVAIARLVNAGSDNFAIWVVHAPYPKGHVLRDCVWSGELHQAWQEWQQMFARHSRLDISPNSPQPPKPLLLDLTPASGQNTNYGGRLMQYLGISLWRWVFDGSIFGSLEHSQGIATGQNTRLRFRLEIRDPALTAIPWEIMQREPGQAAMSLGQNVIFSRTTSEVETLPDLRTDPDLNILLVLGEADDLDLKKEATTLEQTLTDGAVQGSYSNGYAPCMVNILVQPTPQQLIQHLERGRYNVLFYAGHGKAGPDGGLLFLRPGMTINGMELAQVLTGSGVKLAVFNACSGAQPAAVTRQATPYSSLAEVLIRQGVPAVLGMRDVISDEESHTFIQVFAMALRRRLPIDEAVAEARQNLLRVYRFNQPAWTLPVLYLHPDFNGELINSFDDTITELPPTSITGIGSAFPTALFRSPSSGGRSYILGPKVNKIGRADDNDIVIPEPAVSKHHAEILYRNTFRGATPVRTYYLKEKSTYGTTWILDSNGTEQQIHHQEVRLESGMQLKFGSMRSEPWEFVIQDS